MNARNPLAGLWDDVFRSGQVGAVETASNHAALSCPDRPDARSGHSGRERRPAPEPPLVPIVPSDLRAGRDSGTPRRRGCPECADRPDLVSGGGDPVGGVAREPIAPLLDQGGDPCRRCLRCAGRLFHRAPGVRWRCWGCEPPTVPPAHRAAGWVFCGLPPDPLPELLAAASQVVAGVVATSDEGELLVEGES